MIEKETRLCPSCKRGKHSTHTADYLSHGDRSQSRRRVVVCRCPKCVDVDVLNRSGSVISAQKWLGDRS